jgi:hypothetical protein
MIGGRELPDRVFLIVILKGDGVSRELVSDVPRYDVAWHPRGFVLKALMKSRKRSWGKRKPNGTSGF